MKRELMQLWKALQKFARSDIGMLLLLALASVLLHTFTNGRYGFHRDELASLDDGRHLAWATLPIRRSLRSSRAPHSRSWDHRSLDCASPPLSQSAS